MRSRTVESVAAKGPVLVDEAGIRVLELDIQSKELADYLREVPEEEWEQRLVQALEVGVFCLERAKTAVDLEFVRRQVDSILNQVDATVAKIPAKLEQELLGKIGSGDGQVLAPVKTMVEQAVLATKERFAEVKKMVEEVDPDRESSALGRSVRSIQGLLDPKRTDSVQASIHSALERVTAQDGALAKAVKEVVAESIRPLRENIERLALEVRGEEAAAEALLATTQKGGVFEDEVVARLAIWARSVGAEVHSVGGDNRTGDIVIEFPAVSLAATGTTLVVEARDRADAAGRKVIAKQMAEAMEKRGSNSGIYLSRSRCGLAKEIGEWAEGTCEHGRWVACTPEHLMTAVRFLHVMGGLDRMRASNPEVDAISIEGQVQRIRSALKRVADINRKARVIREGADGIQTEAEALRDEIKGALIEVEDALRAVPATAGVIDAA